MNGSRRDAPDQGPENLSDILGKMFVARGWGRQAERARLEQAWTDVVGVEFSGDCRVISLKRSILEVEVRNPVLMQELSQFHKRRLMAKLTERLPGQTIRDLKFRAGAW